MDRDAGAMLRDGIKCMEKLGVCPEAVWKCLGRWIAVAREFVVCHWFGAERDWRRD